MIQLINAINKKEIMLRDAIKGSTAFAVGWKTQVTLLGGLGKFCNTIQQKSLNFIKNNPRLKPVEYLTTPEGLLFNAASKSNKVKSSESGNTSSQLKDVTGSKISKSSKSIAVAPSAKGIICKGDLRAKIEEYKDHIFSKEHIEAGILALGKDKPTIMDSLYGIIASLDKKGLLKESPNQIKTTINDIGNVEIRCFIQNGEAISANAYLSKFGRIYGNFIDTTKV